MKSVLSHLELSIKNKQCFMCKNFKGDSSVKGSFFNSFESCRVNNLKEPFDWFEYYRYDKHPPESLSHCKGENFILGGKYHRIYKNLKREYE